MRHLNSRDLLQFHTASDPQISPDGLQAAWVRTWVDADENRYRSRIFITLISSGESRPLVSAGTGRESHPRWSPDGRQVAYLRDGQLHTTPVVGGGSSLQLTDLKHAVRQHTWSPDGSRIAFSTLVDPIRGLIGRDDPLDGDDSDPYIMFNRDIITTHRAPWKLDGIGFLGDLVSQIVTVGTNGQAQPELLTLGDYNLDTPAWSPDGKRLAVTGNINANAGIARQTFVYLVDPKETRPAPLKELFGLSTFAAILMSGPSLDWSPDGSTIALCGHVDRRIGHYGTERLWLIPVAGGKPECLTRDTDLSLGDASRNSDTRGYGGPDGPRWLPGGRELLVLVNQTGNVHLTRVTNPGGKFHALTEGDRVVNAFTIDRSASTCVLLISDDLNTGDLYVMNLAEGGSSLRRLTDVNGAVTTEVTFTPSIRFQFPSGGWTVDGWIVPPANRVPGKKYPTILYNGGGPGGMRASVFCFEWQVYAAAGYAVLHCNARGNHGYGEAFHTDVRGQWGAGDFDDNMAMVDAAIEQFDFIDPDQLCVAGGSYGGYMTNWIISHSDRFKAAVSDRCVFNRYSQNGTSDIGYLLDSVEYDDRTPWDDPDTYLKWSPMMYVANIKTPTLVLHSALDHRCAVEQGEQLYMALKRLGVPTELVRYPNENHNLSRGGLPWHRISRIDHYLRWFGQWVK